MSNPKLPIPVGQVFTRLTVLREVPHPEGENPPHQRWVECRCSCGELVTIRWDGVKNGRSKSCGCLRKEHCAKIRHLTLRNKEKKDE